MQFTVLNVVRLFNPRCRAYDRAAIKFRGLEADINFNLNDYEEDLKQVLQTRCAIYAFIKLSGVSSCVMVSDGSAAFLDEELDQGGVCAHPAAPEHRVSKGQLKVPRCDAA